MVKRARYRGVTASGPRWKAEIRHGGKHYSLGTHDLKADAARAYDAKARELGVLEVYLNFPVGLPPREGPPPSRCGKQIGAAGFKGVTRRVGGRYQAKIYSGGKQAASSYHDTAEAAARAYDAFARADGRPEAGLNFPRGGQPSAVKILTQVVGLQPQPRSAEAAPARPRAAARRRAPPAKASAGRAGAGGSSAAGADAAWLAEAEGASLPRLRALLQTALDVVADGREAVATARLREMVSSAERAEAMRPRRREAAGREGNAEAAALHALAAGLAEMGDGDGDGREAG